MDSPEKDNDEQINSAPTFDEIISSVLQVKSVLRDRIKFSLPIGREEKGISHIPVSNSYQTDPVSRTNSLRLKCTPSEQCKCSSLYTSRVLSSRYKCTEQSQNSQNLLQSTSKMTRSVSTPEMNSKFMPVSSSNTKSGVHRKMDFYSCHSNKREDDDEEDEETSEARESVHKMLYKGSLFNSHKKSKNNSSTFNDLFNLTPIPKESEDTNKSSSLSDLGLYRPKNNEILYKNSHQVNEKFKPFENEKLNAVNQFLDLKISSKQERLLPLNECLSSSNLNFTDRQHALNREKNKASKTLFVNDSSEGIRSQSKENVPTKLSFQQDALLFKTPTSKVSSVDHRVLPSPSPSPSLTLGNSDVIIVKGLSYFKLGILGKGGSSIVHEVLDLQTRQRKAIKIVTLEEEDESTRNSYKNEIKILKQLQYSPRVIKFYDHEETASKLKLVMEAGEIDLSKILSEARQKKKTPISAFSIQHYWQGMLLAVQVIHQEGIIHSDLKPANFLLVNGTLKLIDFGIASSVQQDMTSVFKDSQAGTYNYMSPESLSDIYSGPIINGKVEDKPTIKISVKSDVWSLGCILYNLVYGKTPFQHLQPLQKLAAISNAKTIISFPPVTNEKLLDVMRKCLQFDRYKRPSIKELLRHPYLDGSVTLQGSLKDTKPEVPSNAVRVQSVVFKEMGHNCKASS